MDSNPCHTHHFPIYTVYGIYNRQVLLLYKCHKPSFVSKLPEETLIHMRHILKSAFALTAVFALAATASASGVQSGDAFRLQMAGQSSWEVSCVLAQSDGDRVSSHQRGRSEQDRGRVLASDILNAQCSYAVPQTGMLQVSLDLSGTGFDCPFTIVEDGFCGAHFTAGQQGSFSIRRLPETGPALTN